MVNNQIQLLGVVNMGRAIEIPDYGNFAAVIVGMFTAALAYLEYHRMPQA